MIRMRFITVISSLIDGDQGVIAEIGENTVGICKIYKVVRLCTQSKMRGYSLLRGNCCFLNLYHKNKLTSNPFHRETAVLHQVHWF